MDRAFELFQQTALEKEATAACHAHDGEKLHDVSGSIMRENKELERNREPDFIMHDSCVERHTSWARILRWRAFAFIALIMLGLRPEHPVHQ